MQNQKYNSFLCFYFMTSKIFTVLFFLDCDKFPHLRMGTVLCLTTWHHPRSMTWNSLEQS